MAKQYEPLSRNRRVMLQVVLWGVLAATVGLAVVVRGALDRGLGIALGPPQEIETLRVRLPEGWVTSSDPIAGGVRILAYENVPEAPTEHLEILHFANPAGLSPNELLRLPWPRGIPDAYFVREGPVQPNPTGALERWDRLIEIAGVEGVMKQGRQFTRDSQVAWRDVFAAVSLPNQEAIIVKLRTLRPADELESRREPLLLRRVAESLELLRPVRPSVLTPTEPRDEAPAEVEEPLTE